jgi:hypothetical protein
MPILTPTDVRNLLKTVDKNDDINVTLIEDKKTLYDRIDLYYNALKVWSGRDMLKSCLWSDGHSKAPSTRCYVFLDGKYGYKVIKDSDSIDTLLTMLHGNDLIWSVDIEDNLF